MLAHKLNIRKNEIEENKEFISLKNYAIILYEFRL